MKWTVKEPDNKEVFTGYRFHVKVGEYGTTTPIITSTKDLCSAKEVFRLYHQMLSTTLDESVILDANDKVMVLEGDKVFFEGTLDKALRWSKPPKGE
jgi:hypothetical protein